MVGQDAGILKKVDVALLTAADRGRGLVQDELFSRQRPAVHVEPTVLQGALDQPHGGAGEKSKQSKTDDTAEPATTVKRHGDRVEHQPAEPRTQDSAEDAVLGPLGGLAEDSIDRPTRDSKDGPSQPAGDPRHGIAMGHRPQFRGDRQPDRVHKIGEDLQEKREDDSQGQRQGGACQRFAQGSFHDAFGKGESNADRGHDRRHHPGIAPGVRSAVGEAWLADGPAHHGAGEAGHPQVEPAFEQDVPFLLIGSGHFRLSMNAAVVLVAGLRRGKGRCRHRRGRLGDRHMGQVVGCDLDRRPFTHFFCPPAAAGSPRSEFFLSDGRFGASRSLDASSPWGTAEPWLCSRMNCSICSGVTGTRTVLSGSKKKASSTPSANIAVYDNTVNRISTHPGRGSGSAGSRSTSVSAEPLPTLFAATAVPSSFMQTSASLSICPPCQPKHPSSSLCGSYTQASWVGAEKKFCWMNWSCSERKTPNPG